MARSLNLPPLRGANSPGVRGAFRLLTIIARQPEGIAFNQLKAKVGLPAATCSRLLRVLKEEGWVEGGGRGRTWRIGAAFASAASFAEPSTDLGLLLASYVETLSRATRESAALVTLDPVGILFRAKYEQPNSWHYLSVGQRNHVVATHGFGQVCLAHLDPEALGEPLMAARIRKSPWHVYRDQALRIAASVRDARGQFVAAMGISLPLKRVATEDELYHLGAVLQDHAERASEALKTTSRATDT